MSARSAIGSTHDSAASHDVMRAVGAARRRLRTVTAVRLVSIAAPAGVTVGAMLALAGLAPAWATGALGALGTAAAVAWAVARTPPMATVAGILDAQLGLRDRVAAAVQLHESDGPIATLVARDAAACLASVRLAAVFPLALDRTSSVSLALAGASLAWLVSSVSVGEPAHVRARSLTGDAASAEAGARGRGDSHQGSRAAATTATPPAAAQPAPPSDAAPRPGDARGDSTREAFAPVAAPRDPQAAQPARTEARELSANAAGTSHQGTPAAAAGNAAARTARGGAGTGAAPNGSVAAGAGGALPGNALAPAGGGSPAPPITVPSRTARANAEAALARDVVPPDYRAHVRAYFRAIPAPQTGPGGTR